LPDPLSNRLREASIVLTDERIEELRTAVERLAAQRLSLNDVFARIRFAELLPTRDKSRERILTQINRDAELLAPVGTDQLLAVLCTCALIENFARTEASRSFAVTKRLTIAAVSAETLVFSASHAAHPDLNTWAKHWLRIEGRRLRQQKHSPPPKLGPQPEREEVPVEQAHGEDITRLEENARETGDWLELSAGAGSIEALREQGQMLWWLAAGERPESLAEQSVRAATELASISLIPPPPASGELIKRRLGERGVEKVAPDDFEALRSKVDALSAASEVIEELTPLLAHGITAPLDALTFSHALYKELILVSMIREERRQEEVRRQAQIQARKRAQDQAQAAQAGEEAQA
jgi:hypothetical protein